LTNDYKWSDVSKRDANSALNAPKSKAWWVHHRRMTENMMHCTDWNLDGPAMARLPSARRRWVSKHVSEKCGIGTTLVKWNMQVDMECALYGTNKDTEHIICCPDHRVLTKWAQSINNLCNWLNL
jgi:hypothetical protein